MLGMEETVIFKDTKLEEIQKYFINDSISEKERAMYLIKKSYPKQKRYFASHLHCYLHYNCNGNSTKAERQFLIQIINIIIEHLDLWDSETCIEFSKSLCLIMIELMTSKTKRNNSACINEEDNELCLICLTHFIKAIMTMEKTVSDGYLASLSKCINTICYSPLMHKLKPNEEIINVILQIGKIGQNLYNIKYALYFITCIVRISSEYQEALLNCFTSQIYETQKDFKYEVAYDLRYILKEIDLGYIKSNYYHIMKTYLTENDIILKEIICDSLFCNIDLCDISIKNIMNTTINELFSSDDSYALTTDFIHLNHIFTSMINCFYDNIIRDNQQNIKGIDYQSLIVLYLKKFLIGNNKNKGEDSSISSDDSFKSNSDLFNEQYEINYIFKIFDKISKALIYSNDTVFLNACFNSLMSQVNNKNEAEFYNNIDNIIRYIHSDLLNAKQLTNIFDFLNKEESNDNNSNNDSNDKSSIGFLNKKFNYTKFGEVMTIMKDNSNEHFFLMLFGNSNHITQIINNLSHNWRNQLEIIKSFSSSVLFYLVRNYTKFPYSDWLKELFDLTKNYLLLENTNYVLSIEYAKLLARLSKYMMSRKEVIDFANKELLNNQSYYKRRLICPFIEECHNILSYEVFEEMKLGEYLLKLLDDKTVILKQWVIKYAYSNQSVLIEDWVTIFNAKVNQLYEGLTEIEDKELRIVIELYYNIKENINKTDKDKCINSSEDNAGKREEERTIKEIEKVIIQFPFTKKNQNHNNNNSNNNSNTTRSQVHKKPGSFSRKSNPYAVNYLRVNNKKGSSQKLQKPLVLKTSDDSMTYNSISSLSSSIKQKTQSSITLMKTFEEKKIGKTRNEKRKSVKLFTYRNHKNV